MITDRIRDCAAFGLSGPGHGAPAVQQRVEEHPRGAGSAQIPARRAKRGPGQVAVAGGACRVPARHQVSCLVEGDPLGVRIDVHGLAAQEPHQRDAGVVGQLDGQ